MPLNAVAESTSPNLNAALIFLSRHSESFRNLVAAESELYFRTMLLTAAELPDAIRFGRAVRLLVRRTTR